MIDLKSLIAAGDAVFAENVLTASPDWKSIKDELPDDGFPGESPVGDPDIIDDEDAIPTEEMALAAQSAIDTLRSIPLYKRPLYIGAVETVRARDISNRVELDKDQIDRMAEFFAKHEDERIQASFDPESRFGLQWASWGGDAGNEWIKTRK